MNMDYLNFWLRSFFPFYWRFFLFTSFSGFYTSLHVAEPEQNMDIRFHLLSHYIWLWRLIIFGFFKAKILLKKLHFPFAYLSPLFQQILCSHNLSFWVDVIYVTHDKQRTISFSLAARQMSCPQILISQCKYHQNIIHLLCFSYYTL